MIDADLVADLRRSFAAALDDEDPAAARRELVEAGWLDALEMDERAAVAIVFREQGRSGHDAAALDDVVVRHVARRWPAAEGDVAVAYPVARPSPGRIRPTHIVFPARRGARRVLWLPDLTGDRLELVDLDGPFDAPVVRGVDAGAGWLGLAARPPGVVTELPDGESRAVWGPALAAGRVALAHQLLSGAHALLAAAVVYASDRRQFGVPIGSFQAVKHRLAETLAAISAGDAATAAAGAIGTQAGAAVAKALAGRAAATAGRNCLQVFGGIGFTTEHEFHRRFRPSLVLDRMLGDPRTLERELGAALRSGTLDDRWAADLDDDPRLDLG